MEKTGMFESVFHMTRVSEGECWSVRECLKITANVSGLYGESYRLSRVINLRKTPVISVPLFPVDLHKRTQG